MDKILQFLLKSGELKKIKRKGISFYKSGEPDSASDHSFRMALMAWLFSQNKKIDPEKAMKMALIHDIAKVLTGDITPYDGLLPKNSKQREEFVKKWRRLPLKEKEKRYKDKLKKEEGALKKLTGKLPPALREDIISVWLEYYQGKSPEAKFVHQIDVLENLLESLEMWLKNKTFPTQPWWERADEAIDDPQLLKLMKEIEDMELGRE